MLGICILPLIPSVREKMQVHGARINIAQRRPSCGSGSFVGWWFVGHHLWFNAGTVSHQCDVCEWLRLL